MLVDIEALRKEAEKHLEDFDVIVDQYDMTYVWASDKMKTVLGDPHLENKRISESAEEVTGEKFDQAKPSDMVQNGVFVRSALLHPADGSTKKVTSQIKNIEFDGQPYVLVKVIKIEDYQK